MTTILFADDCANIREFCREELEEEGYRIILAHDGQEAVDFAGIQPPDIAILDISMPNVDGFEAAQRIAAIEPGTRIILFTNNDDLCLRDPRSIFAAACVEKSADLAELKRAIASVLAARKSGRLPRIGLPPIQRCVPSTAAVAVVPEFRPPAERPALNLSLARGSLRGNVS
jgi:CheY-like chemotaxis protein